MEGREFSCDYDVLRWLEATPADYRRSKREPVVGSKLASSKLGASSDSVGSSSSSLPNLRGRPSTASPSGRPNRPGSTARTSRAASAKPGALAENLLAQTQREADAAERANQKQAAALEQSVEILRRKMKSVCDVRERKQARLEELALKLTEAEAAYHDAKEFSDAHEARCLAYEQEAFDLDEERLRETSRVPQLRHMTRRAMDDCFARHAALIRMRTANEQVIAEIEAHCAEPLQAYNEWSDLRRRMRWQQQHMGVVEKGWGFRLGALKKELDARVETERSREALERVKADAQAKMDGDLDAEEEEALKQEAQETSRVGVATFLQANAMRQRAASLEASFKKLFALFDATDVAELLPKLTRQVAQQGRSSPLHSKAQLEAALTEAQRRRDELQTTRAELHEQLTLLKTTGEDGVETVHKLKFLRMEELNVMSVSEFPADKNLEFGFVIHFPDRPAYFKAPSAAVRASFLMHFAAACADLDDTHNQRREALKRVHGT